MSDRRGEAGAASIVALALAFALVVVAWGSGSVVALVVAQRTAQNAADLTALAAAQDAACSRAAEVAVANHARLVRCDVRGQDVTVEVVVTASFGRDTDVRARARAGPG